MREKTGPKTRARGEAAQGEVSRCVRSDLERRGVAPEYSQSVADRLRAIAADLDSKEYAAVLDGVAAACAVPRPADGTHDPEITDLAEMRRLVEGFTGELRKLDEGLQILSAYVVRMTARASRAIPPTLH